MVEAEQSQMLSNEGSQEVLTAGIHICIHTEAIAGEFAVLQGRLRQNRLRRENTPMIECSAYSACFVQGWEKGLGRAQMKRLLC